MKRRLFSIQPLDRLGSVTVSNEDFDFEDAIGHDARGSALADFMGSSITSRRILFGVVSIFLIFVIIFFRVVYLQVVKGSYYFGVAEGNRIQKEQLHADRGLIYDRNGKLLVTNIPAFSLWLDSDYFNRNGEGFVGIDVIADLVGEDTDFLLESLSENRAVGGEILVTRDLSFNEAMRVLASLEDYPGLRVEAGTVRKYDVDGVYTASSLLGYTGVINAEEYEDLKGIGYFPVDYIGKIGLEKSFETLLRGFPGERLVEVDARGRRERILEERLARDGANLTLKLDIELQTFIEDRLDDIRDKRGIKNASVIVLDPRDGGVISLVSYPGYDANSFSGGISSKEYAEMLEDDAEPLFTRAISGLFPSGSTFKPIVAAAALDAGIIDDTTTFISTGGISIGQFFFPDWKAGGHGKTDVYKAIADSVNTFFYIIGGGKGEFDGIGLTRMMEAAARFGLGSPLGIDLPGEASGFLPTAEWKMRVKGEPWYIGDTYHVAIGQGDILVTPLQVAGFTSVFANGGTLYTPQLVDGYEMQGSYHDISPRVIRDSPQSDEAIDIVRKGLRRTVTNGSARRLNSLPFTSAGKTGTAQWNSKKNNHAWFTGFAPYENPEIVVTVLVEEGGEGSTVAVPLARDIMEWWFSK